MQLFNPSILEVEALLASYLVDVQCGFVLIIKLRFCVLSRNTSERRVCPKSYIIPADLLKVILDCVTQVLSDRFIQSQIAFFFLDLIVEGTYFHIQNKSSSLDL